MSDFKRVYILCEGQTEESFVKNVLYGYFIRKSIIITPIILSTSQGHKGGVVSYGQVYTQVLRLCKQDHSAWVTTMIDMYALPPDFPGYDLAMSCDDYHMQYQMICNEFEKDVSMRNFVANVTVHEFETLLFCDPNAFSSWFGAAAAKKLMEQLANCHNAPEFVNKSPETAPSKRILSICPHYSKVLHGTLIALEIGLETIRSKCEIFNAWINKIEQLGG